MAGRALATAELQGDGSYRCAEVSPPDPRALIERLRARAKGGTVLLGFDFPIGLPGSYAARVGVESFPAWLASLPAAAWDRFRTPADVPAEIGPERPFFPGRAGGASHRALVEAHGVTAYASLLRRCDRPTTTRPAACCMFWTLGPKQCGRAALAGWHEVLRPALRDQPDVALWPFHGSLDHLLHTSPCIVAETYPAEFYPELAPPHRFSKRRQADRQRLAAGLVGLASRVGLTLGADASHLVQQGFGPRAAGENAFDALIGLLGMLLVVRGTRSAATASDPIVPAYEGWMLGLDPATLRTTRAALEET